MAALVPGCLVGVGCCVEQSGGRALEGFVNTILSVQADQMCGGPHGVRDGAPFNTLLMTGFLADFPSEIEEAAIIDGAGLWQVCVNVVLPIMKPVIATILIFNIVYVFNEFPFASILINNPDLVTVSLAVSRFQGQFTVDYGGMMASATMVLVPQLIIYAFFQRQIIAGMTAGAVKG